MARKVAWVLSIVLLALTGVAGVLNGTRELAANTMNVFQRSVTIGVLVYGVLGLAGAVGLVGRRAWSVWLAGAWGVVVTYVAATAAIAYGGPGVPASAAIFGSAGAAIIAAGVVWGARVATRGRATSAP